MNRFTAYDEGNLLHTPEQGFTDLGISSFNGNNLDDRNIDRPDKSQVPEDLYLPSLDTLSQTDSPALKFCLIPRERIIPRRSCQSEPTAKIIYCSGYSI